MANIIKSVCRKILPVGLRESILKFCEGPLKETFFYRVLRKVKRKIKKTINKQKYSMDYERPVQLGKMNSDILFYVIGYYHDSNFLHQGVLSTWLDFMPQVMYALQKGYVPIIDMKNNWKPMMLDESNKGKVNAWELYFKQPSQKYDLENVLHSKNVIFAKNKRLYLSYDIQWANLPLSDVDFETCKRMIKYGNLSDNIINAGDAFININFPVGKKIIGVSFRRAFEKLHYFNSELTPPGTHNVRVTLSGLLEIIRDVLFKFNYEYIFFTADDRESYGVVKKEFGPKCIFVQRPVGHHFEDNKPVPLDRPDVLCCEFNKRDNDCMLREMEYMTDVYILSKCDSLLAAGGSADLFAYILNDKKYEHVIQPS